MSEGEIHTFTVIRVNSAGALEEPYAIAIVDVEDGRLSARVDGDLSWLEVGARTTVEPAGGAILRAVPLAG